MSEYLSPNFTLEEMIYSDTAKAKKINKSPTEVHKKVLKHTCQYLLEPLRALLNEKYKTYNGKQVKKVTIKVTSGYRSAALNAAIPGSSKTSQQCQGCAADIEATVVYMNNVKNIIPYTTLYEDIKRWVKEGRLSVDQCIQERSGSSKWVHVSHSSWGKSKDRRQFLKYLNGRYTLDVDLA